MRDCDQRRSARTLSARYVQPHINRTRTPTTLGCNPICKLQNNLAQLKMQHALNPPANAWIGVVTDWLRLAIVVGQHSEELNETAPFLQRPIELAYSVNKTTLDRRATISLFLTLHDEQSGFGDAVELIGLASSHGEGLEGVSERDTQGLQNHEPSLENRDQWIPKAWEEVRPRLREAVSELGQRMFLARAATSFYRHDPPMRTLGNLLDARELGKAAAILESYAPAYGCLMQRVRWTSVLKWMLNGFPRYLKGGSIEYWTFSETDASGRPSMLQILCGSRACKSRNYGSGFFVGSRSPGGQCHVIEGGRIVGARQMAEFFITLISISNEHDLFLEVVLGHPASLRLGVSSMSPSAPTSCHWEPKSLQMPVTRE